MRPGRLFREERERWTEVDLGDSTGPVATVCMEEAALGNLWLGPDRGLFQLRKRQVLAYTTRDSLADWVGTLEGISCIENGAGHSTQPEGTRRGGVPIRLANPRGRFVDSHHARRCGHPLLFHPGESAAKFPLVNPFATAMFCALL